MKYYKQKQQLTERDKLHEILGDRTIDIILIALQWMENELYRFPDKQMELGRDLTVKATDIEPIKEFLRYG